jgi:hypothetical protein
MKLQAFSYAYNVCLCGPAAVPAPIGTYLCQFSLLKRPRIITTHLNPRVNQDEYILLPGIGVFIQYHILWHVITNVSILKCCGRNLSLPAGNYKKSVFTADFMEEILIRRLLNMNKKRC